MTGLAKATAQKRRRKAKAPPISSHPLFPVTVGLWFGALFSLGSLAIRPALLERMVLAAQIDLIVPAAAPPLGVTARILLALGLGAAGAVLGIMLARRFARSKPEPVRKRRAPGKAQNVRQRPRDAHPDAPARRPISAREEFASATAIEGAEPSLPGRRRALAVSDEGARTDYQNHVPLPGGDHHGLELAAQRPTTPLPEAVYAHVEEEPGAALDLGSFDTAAEPAPPFGSQVFQPAAKAEPEPETVFESVTPFANQVSETEAEPDYAFRSAIAQQPAAPPLFTRPQAEAPRQMFEPLPHDEDHAPEPQAADLPPRQLFAAPEPAPVQPEPPVQAQPGSLGALGMVELAERLSRGMEQRRTQAVEPEPVSPAPAQSVQATLTPEFDPAHLPQMPAIFAIAPAHVAAPAAAPAPAETQIPVAQVPEAGELPDAPVPLPAALRPVVTDDDELDLAEGAFDALLPPRLTPPAPPAPFAPPAMANEDLGEEADDDENGDDGYSSLLDLALTPPPRQQFVRIGEPEPVGASIEPVVIFPGQAARAPEQRIDAAPVQVFQAAGEASPATPPAPSDPVPIRRFDAPAGVNGQGQPVAGGLTAPQLDREETERALRAALATLQRMSGAA